MEIERNPSIRLERKKKETYNFDSETSEESLKTPEENPEKIAPYESTEQQTK